jgi:hypothetical protein
MTKISTLLAIAYLTCCQISVPAGQPLIGDDFPADFKDRAFRHIVRLAEFGPRSPGFEGEGPALQYICQQFEDAGLEVRVERFDYETFKIEHIDFNVCGEKVDVETIGFNPYSGRRDFGGKALFIGPDVTGSELSDLDLRDEIVVTTSPVNYFSLFPYSPRLIVYVGNSDFNTLIKNNCLSCSLVVSGTIETGSSANIIAELASKSRDDKEVIVSAHWDSYRDSPGADDNGSGVGVLLELARYFSNFEGRIGGTIKFVSFGAEELGVVGSRAYLNMHHRKLRDCILAFNIDRVGGPRGPAVEMLGGVDGVPKRKGATQFPARIRNRAFEGPEGRWRIADSDLIDAFTVTNRPTWLVEAIETTATQFGFEFRPTGNLGSDQQVFTQAGIVATSIGTSGNRYHSPEDVPEQINKDNLEVVGKIVANVVLLSFRQ